MFKTKQQSSSKSKKNSFGKRLHFFKIFLVYFNLALVTFFVMTILLTIALIRQNKTDAAATTFVVGHLWSFSFNDSTHLFNIEYTTYQWVIIVTGILTIIFLTFSLFYFLRDERNTRKIKLFGKEINWGIVLFPLVFIAIIALIISVLIQITSVAKEINLNDPSHRLGNLWNLQSSSNFSTYTITRTNSNKIIVVFLWIWLIIFLVNSLLFAIDKNQSEKRD